MKITIYKCVKCQRERVERDRAYEVCKNSVLKPTYEFINDICLPCKRIKRLKDERRVSLEQDLDSLRKEYKTATSDRKKEIKSIADDIKNDASFVNDVIDNLM